MEGDLGTLLDVDSRIVKLFSFDVEQKKVVVGTDEAGRGCGAGGVFAAAVCFNHRSKKLIEDLADLNDSKKLSSKKREYLFDIIKENSINSTVCIEVDEIERINILNASLKAMRMASRLKRSLSFSNSSITRFTLSFAFAHDTSLKRINDSGSDCNRR